MTSSALLNTEEIRKDFPVLERIVRNDRPLVYLDSANTSQKPRQVLDTLASFYERHNANIHRATHLLGEESTALYEGARDKVTQFVNAPSRDEVIFTKNVTEALNLVANVLCWAEPRRGLGPGPGPGQTASPPCRLGPGDEVVITEMEHHSNIVPWQLATQRSGATLKWLGLTDDGRLDLSNLDEIITERTKVVSFVLVSNILGTVNPAARIIARAREVGALVVVDAAQAAPHMPLDVAALGADLVGFTGHKMCGPTGIGVLWGRRDVLDALPPFLGGGEMIEAVWMDHSTYAGLPHKYEAGTPPIAQAIGLGAAVDYLTEIGMARIAEHEHALVSYALDGLATVDGLRIVGPPTAQARGATISFTLDGLHPHDVGQVLDELGIAVRVGHHCARPTCLRYGVPATTRASFYLYNTPAEVDALVAGLDHVKRFFA